MERKKELSKILKIIAFGRGHVVIGQWEYRVLYEGVHGSPPIVGLTCHFGATIRNWGTTQGIGEISAKGFLANTIIDPIPHGIGVPVQAIHGQWDVSSVAEKQCMPVLEKECAKLIK